MVPDRIEREILIEAPVELVWSIVTEPEHIAGWLSDSHFLSFRWVGGSRDPGGGADLGERNSTLVELRLTAEGDGTCLPVAESGFRQLDGSDEANSSSAEDHRRGWKRELGELRDYISTVPESALRAIVPESARR